MTEIQHLSPHSENSETKVRLILLALTHTRSNTEAPPLEQFIWGLALIQTIEVAMMWQDQDIAWMSERTFQSLHAEIHVKTGTWNENAQDNLIVSLRVSIEKLHQTHTLAKIRLLTMLYDFVNEVPYVEQLKKFLLVELRVAQGVEAYISTMKDTEDDEEEPEFDRAFQEKFRKTLLSMLHTSRYIAVFARFRDAYEYRKSFPWLAESQETSDDIHQDGLAYALQAALVGYLVPETGEAEDETAPGMSRLRDEDEYICADSAWVSRLEAAVSMTVAEGFSLERFESSLARAKVDIASVPPSVLRKYIAAALLSYYNQRRIGITPDPF